MTHIQTPLPPTRTHTRTHTDSIRRPPGLDAARRSPGRSHRRPHRLRRRARAGGRRARWGGVGGADGGLVPCTVRRRIGGLRCCAARYVASPGLSRPLRTACIFLFSCRACPRAHTHTPNHPLPPQTHTGTWRRCSSCTTPTRTSTTRGAPANFGSWSDTRATLHRRRRHRRLTKQIGPRGPAASRACGAAALANRGAPLCHRRAPPPPGRVLQRELTRGFLDKARRAGTPVCFAVRLRQSGGTTYYPAARRRVFT